MNPEVAHFDDARKRMVDSQIRPNRVTDPRVLSAMRRLPREQFLPPEVWPLAYADDDVPLGNDRFMMEPMVLARMLQSASLRESERVLVVAAGSGYSAAVLAACGCQVTALEEDTSLLAIARHVLATLAPAVAIVAGPLVAGWPARGPYDLVFINGAVQHIPPALVEQTHQESGRIITAIGGTGRVTQAAIAERTAFGLGMSPLFDCATPIIPAFRTKSAFAF